MKSEKCCVLGVDIDHLSMKEAIEKLIAVSYQKEQGYVCFVNVHSIVTAVELPAFNKVLNGAFMALPDGMPVSWMMRLLGCKQQQRVCGPDLMLQLCQACSTHRKKIFLYGSTDQTLQSLENELIGLFPELSIVGSYSPPFRELTTNEIIEVTKLINKSEADFIFVSLGCPKQEIWMANLAQEINGIMLGVGAAFDFYAGNIKRAPLWMRRVGLEWLHRLISEPNRLFWRYLRTNSLFIYYAFLNFFSNRK